LKKLGYMHWGLPSMARLTLGPSGLDPGLELRPRTAALRQHIRLLLPAQAYNSCQEDLHEDANARFSLSILNLTNYNLQIKTMGAWLTTFT
jgi:hypothetical protein